MELKLVINISSLIINHLADDHKCYSTFSSEIKFVDLSESLKCSFENLLSFVIKTHTITSLRFKIATFVVRLGSLDLSLKFKFI